MIMQVFSAKFEYFVLIIHYGVHIMHTFGHFDAQKNRPPEKYGGRLFACGDRYAILKEKTTGGHLCFCRVFTPTASTTTDRTRSRAWRRTPKPRAWTPWASAGTARFRSQTIGRSTRAVWQIICARRAACRRTFAAAFPSTAGWSGTAAHRCRSRSSII